MEEVGFSFTTPLFGQCAIAFLTAKSALSRCKKGVLGSPNRHFGELKRPILKDDIQHIAYQ